MGGGEVCETGGKRYPSRGAPQPGAALCSGSHGWRFWPAHSAGGKEVQLATHSVLPLAEAAEAGEEGEGVEEGCHRVVGEQGPHVWAGSEEEAVEEVEPAPPPPLSPGPICWHPGSLFAARQSPPLTSEQSGKHGSAPAPAPPPAPPSSAGEAAGAR